MKELEDLKKLAKEVITAALGDCIINKTGGPFKHQGTPYVDKDDCILWSKISADRIDKQVVAWFESRSRQRFSYLYWLQYAEMNPNAINNFIKKLRSILNGAVYQDDKKVTTEKIIDGLNILYPETAPKKIIAKGYLPYAYPHHKSRKWMNV